MLTVLMPPRLSSSLRRRPGRPRKFATPSRAVTVTLPESVFEILRGVDSDVSRAIARMAERHPAPDARQPAELSVFGRRAVIRCAQPPRSNGARGSTSSRCLTAGP